LEGKQKRGRANKDWGHSSGICGTQGILGRLDKMEGGKKFWKVSGGHANPSERGEGKSGKGFCIFGEKGRLNS